MLGTVGWLLGASRWPMFKTPNSRVLREAIKKEQVRAGHRRSMVVIDSDWATKVDALVIWQYHQALSC